MEALVLLALVAAVYFLPWIVAAKRDHHQTVAIGLLNLFLGWTLLGWVLALVWAATVVRPTAQAPAPQPMAPLAPMAPLPPARTPKPRPKRETKRRKPRLRWKER